MKTAPAARNSRVPPPSPATREATGAAREAVRSLLQSSQAFAELAPDKRKDLAHGLVEIASYLAAPEGERLKPDQHSAPVRALAEQRQPPQPFGAALQAGTQGAGALMAAVNFPSFVSGLIQGVFHSIVDSSIQQMEAVAKLVADVSKSLDQFRDENTTKEQGQTQLLEQFPDMFEMSSDSGDSGGFELDGEGEGGGGPRVVLREGVDERAAVERLNRDLPLTQPLTRLDDEMVEAVLVPAARTSIATGRQQLLATMVLLGINRIVVTDGRISAKVMYDFQARDKRQYRYGERNVEYEKDEYGNVQKTRTQVPVEPPDTGEGSEENRGAAYYTRGRYRTSEQPIVKLMSTSQLQDDSSLTAKASLAGNVEVNFRSDFLPLDKIANPAAIASIQMNAQPGMLETLAKRPPAPAAATPPPAAAAPAPAPQPAPSAPAQPAA